MVGSFKLRRSTMALNVSSVAVAVKANTFTDEGRTLLSSPKCAKAIRKSSPLRQKGYDGIDNN